MKKTIVIKQGQLMSKRTIERVISVDVITFDDGTEIDSETIYRFLDEAWEFEDTIGEDGNYTDAYLYFQTEEEKKLLPILVKLDVIRKPSIFERWNENVDINAGVSSAYDYHRYWLSDGYRKFRDMFNELNK